VARKVVGKIAVQFEEEAEVAIADFAFC